MLVFTTINSIKIKDPNKYYFFNYIHFFNLNSDLVINELKFSFTNDTIKLGNLSKVFTIICIFTFINALNLFDGIDLQSGSYVLILLLTLGLLNQEIFLFFIIIPIIIFLILNHKKEIFLGDSGTIVLGFFISYIVIKSYKNSIVFVDEIFIMMMIPGIDMIRLFLVRISKGKNPFLGDRNHLHHILVNKFNYKNSLLIINTIILLPIIFVFNLNIDLFFIILVTILIYILLIKRK